MRTPLALAVFSVVLLIATAPGRADDYLGADAILKQVDAQAEAARGSEHKPSPTRQLRLDAKDYQKRAASLPPETAAREWLALFDRAVKLPELSNGSSSNDSAPPRLRPVMAALPPPADWDALAAQIKARPPAAAGAPGRATLVLRIVAGMLQGDHDAVRQAIGALKHQGDGEANGEIPGWMADQLQTAFYKLTGNKQDAIADFEAKLALLKPGADAQAGDKASQEMLRMSELEIPNLVAFAGPARAEALLREVFALTLPGVSIEDAKTKALARTVAETMSGQLKFAPWGLVDTPDAVALYEALDKRFPENPSDYRRLQATGNYLLGLITRGRIDEAVAATLKLNEISANNSGRGGLNGLSENALSELAGKGYAKEVYRFFDRLLTGHPGLPYWRSFLTATTLAGETDAALVKIKTASAGTDLNPSVKRTLRHAYGDALLAADHVAEALPILREVAANESDIDEDGVNGRGRQEAVGEMCTLADIGRLTGDEALVNEQLDAIVKTAKARPEALDSVSFHAAENVNEFFLAAKRGPERERLLVAALLQDRQAAETAAEAREAAPFDPERAVSNAHSTRGTLFELVDLYARVERYQDIVTLLDRTRDWGADDLAGLLVTNGSGGGGLAFWPQVARALQKTGHADAARRTINAFLDRNGGADAAYALLLELLPPGQAETRLNELFQADQFEERPLIWRAVVQLGQGRLDEAEKSARQAIAIDPSDGEQGRGDRMRAYAVLGDILERKGEPDKAEPMRQAVRAIRLSEDADRFYETGLLTRAVAMYEKALGYFSDAYCIQSRLAVQLSALGKFDEAAAHYQRAYELMPESFGRMESHCFGCEGAFRGERAQATAERVFQRLAASQPGNPRVHYLLGYLRGEQDRNAEAAQEYREAVRLDPDYINAWKQLAAVTEEPADRDRAELNLLRLDPRQNHEGASVSLVGDLRGLWAAVEAAEKFALADPANLYPLTASKATLEQERRRHPPKSTEAGDAAEPPERKSLTPPEAIVKNEVVAKVLQFVRGNHGGDRSLIVD